MKFKNLTLLAIFMALCNFSSDAQVTDKVQVYIMAGQSNMVGWGLIKSNANGGCTSRGTLSACKNCSCADPEGSIDLYYKMGYIAHNDEGKKPTSTIVNKKGIKLTQGIGGDADYIGPEYGFGCTLKKMYPGQKIALIKTAWGGASLAKDFRPDASNPNAYNEMADFVNNKVLSSLDEKGVDYEIAGFIWFQGVNDGSRSNKNFAANYETNLRKFITKIREDFSPTMKIVIGTTGIEIPDADEYSWAFIPIVVGAQKSMLKRKSVDDANFSKNIYVLDTSKFWKDEKKSPPSICYTNRGPEFLHWNRNGEVYYDIGAGMAACIDPMKPVLERCMSDPLGNMSSKANFWLGKFTYQNNQKEASICNVTYGDVDKDKCISGTGKWDGCGYNALGFKVAFVNEGLTTIATFSRDNASSLLWTMNYCGQNYSYNSTEGPWGVALHQ